jgi:hypothetical protein
MKRAESVLWCFAAVIAGTLVVAACSSTPPPPQETGASVSLSPPGTGTGSGALPPAEARTIERIRVDYKGAAIGADIPGWVEAAVNNDYDAISALTRFEGRVPIISYGSGQNLDLLQSWVNNFSIQAQVARQISNHVEANFGGEQLGSKDTPANRQFIEEVVATFSEVTINGLSKDLDYWVLLRTIDHGNGTESELYSYYVVYSIAQEDLDYQIAQSMGRVVTVDPEQQELKTDVEEAMKRVALRSIESGQ